MNVARFTPTLQNIDTVQVFSDFWEDQTDLFFVDTVTDSGSVTMGDARKGIVALVPSDGTVADNDEAYLACPNEVFLYVVGKPLYARTLLQFSEANTDDANIAFGFMNAVGANAIVDDGAGVKASGCNVCIYKVDGETVWRCTSRNGSTVTTTQSTTTAGGSSYQTLEIEISDLSSLQMEVTFKVDGTYLVDSNNKVIRHVVAIASATEMQVFVGVKNGGANLETLNVDYLYAHQLR